MLMMLEFIKITFWINFVFFSGFLLTWILNRWYLIHENYLPTILSLILSRIYSIG